MQWTVQFEVAAESSEVDLAKEPSIPIRKSMDE
jgi:hypothetical protein